MNLCFERAMRNALYPVIRRKNRGLTNIFKNDVFNFENTSNEHFNFSVRHLMVINIIHDHLCTGLFKLINSGYVPRTTRDPVVYNQKPFIPVNELEYWYEETTKTNNPLPDKTMSLSLTYTKLVDTYPFIVEMGLTSSGLCKILIQIGTVNFGMIMRLKYLSPKFGTIKGKETLLTVDKTIKTFSSVNKQSRKLFDINLNDEKCVRDDRGLKEFSFELDLTTFYGIVLAQGLLGVNFDWVPHEIYTSKVSEYAKLFYLFLLVGVPGERSLKLTEIVKRLNLTDTHLDQADKTVKSILERLKNEGFVHEYRVEGKIKIRQYEITTTKKDSRSAKR